MGRERRRAADEVAGVPLGDLGPALLALEDGSIFPGTAEFHGQAGNDTLAGGDGPNRIDGEAGNDSRGPKMPKACSDANCPARKSEHLHVECSSCKGKYFMATRTKC